MTRKTRIKGRLIVVTIFGLKFRVPYFYLILGDIQYQIRVLSEEILTGTSSRIQKIIFISLRV